MKRPPQLKKWVHPGNRDQARALVRVPVEETSETVTEPMSTFERFVEVVKAGFILVGICFFSLRLFLRFRQENNLNLECNSDNSELLKNNKALMKAGIDTDRAFNISKWQDTFQENPGLFNLFSSAEHTSTTVKNGQLEVHSNKVTLGNNGLKITECESIPSLVDISDAAEGRTTHKVYIENSYAYAKADERPTCIGTYSQSNYRSKFI